MQLKTTDKVQRELIFFLYISLLYRSFEKKNTRKRENNDLKSLYKNSVEENKQLVDEINCLQDQVTELVYDNGCMRLQLQNVCQLPSHSNITIKFKLIITCAFSHSLLKCWMN